MPRRDFTDDTRARLLHTIDKNQPFENYTPATVGSSATQAEIDAQKQAIKAYNEQMAQQTTEAKKRVNQVFDQANALDAQCAKNLQASLDRLNAISATLARLNDLVTPDALGNTALNLPKAEFLAKLALAGDGDILVQNEFITTYVDGKSTYCTDAIKAIMAKDPSDVTSDQYQELMAVLDSFNMPDGSINTNAMQDLFGESYSNTAPDPNIQAGEVSITSTYALSPVFKTLSAMYTIHVDADLQKYGYSLCHGGNKYLNNELIISGLCSQVATHMDSLTSATIPYGQNPIISITMNQDDAGSVYYGLNSDYEFDGIESVYYEQNSQISYAEFLDQLNEKKSNMIKVYGFNESSSVGVFHDVADAILASMYQDPTMALTKNLANVAISYIPVLGEAYAATKKILLPFQMGDDYNAVVKINEECNSVATDIKLPDLLQTLQMGTAVVVNGNSVRVVFGYINRSALQVDINAYNYTHHTKITLDDIEAGAKTILTDGGTNEVIRKFSKWSVDNTKSAMKDYRDNLQKNIDDFSKTHPELTHLVVDDLTVEQVNELAQAYPNTAY